MTTGKKRASRSSGIVIVSEGLPCIFVDKTDMDHNIERSLWATKAKSEDLLFILNHAPFGIVVNRGETGEVVYNNPEIERITGYTYSEAHDIKTALEAMTPDDVDLEAKMGQLHRIEGAGGGIYLDEIISKDGTRKIIEARAIVLPDKTKVAMWTDVTRREEAERAMREVNADLETRVEKRTEELREINRKLRREIKERKRIEEELTRSREELRFLSEHLQRASEEEKIRISREVHDELGQLLSVMKIDAALLSQNIPRPNGPLMAQAESFENQIDSAIKAVRDVCSRLRPMVLSHFGLSAAIEWYLEDFQKRTGLECSCRINMNIPLEGTELSVVLYRIFQESMTNILRHADASKVHVSLSVQGESVVLLVRDNGLGITKDQMTKPQSFGIIGIRERVRFWGGTSTFDGTPGRGTTVSIVIPIKNANRMPGRYSGAGRNQEGETSA